MFNPATLGSLAKSLMTIILSSAFRQQLVSGSGSWQLLLLLTSASAVIDVTQVDTLVVTLTAYMPIYAYIWLTNSLVESWYVHQFCLYFLYPRRI